MLYGDAFGGLFGEDVDPWVGIESGIRAWVVAASGIPEDHVIYSTQNGPRPSAPFIELAFGDIMPLGAVDAIEQTYDAGAVSGSEITLTTIGQRELSVVLRAYTSTTFGGASARVLLSKLQTSLGVSSVRDTFHAAGVTCFDRGAVQTIPAVLDTRWEGRAQLILRFYVVDTASESSGYITSVELTDQSVDPEETYVVTEP